MGLDGIPTNLGKLARDATSAQMSADGEAIANIKKGDLAIDATNLSRNSEISRKEDNYGEDVANQTFSGGDTSTSTKKEDSTETEEDDENIEYYEKKYTLQPNQINDAILELYDNEFDEVKDTIQTENLVEIASKLNFASGIIINKKV